MSSLIGNLSLQQLLHITIIILGGLGVIAAYLNNMEAAGVISILITTTASIGAYLAPSIPTTPNPPSSP